MPEAVTGLVLAGGRARRMGGCDKGLLAFRGKPMVAHAIERLRPQVDALLLNANQNRQAYAQFDCPVLADCVTPTLEAYAGPLAGLQAGLRACATPLLLTVPCDSPLLPPDLVERLRTGIAAGAELAVARTPTGLQSVFALYRRDLLAKLETHLAGGGRKIEAWHATLHAQAVDFADDGVFLNINTLAELERLQQP